jgi:hypothetical protein
MYSLTKGTRVIATYADVYWGSWVKDLPIPKKVDKQIQPIKNKPTVKNQELETNSSTAS